MSHLLPLGLWLALIAPAIDAAPTLIARVDPGVRAQTHIADGYLPVRMVFAYAGNNYTARLGVSSEAYNSAEKHMNAQPRPGNLAGWIAMARDGADTVQPLARALAHAAPANDSATLARFTLAFVQSLPYKLDVLTTPFDEAWRTPLQTLVDREIDCEDSSILYSSLLSGLDIDSGLIILPGHMMVGVKGPFSGVSIDYQGSEYYSAETTGVGWTIGSIAPAYRGSEARLLPVDALHADATPTQTRFPVGRSRYTPTATSTAANDDAPAWGLWLLLLLFPAIAAAWYFLPGRSTPTTAGQALAQPPDDWDGDGFQGTADNDPFADSDGKHDYDDNDFDHYPRDDPWDDYR